MQREGQLAHAHGLSDIEGVRLALGLWNYGPSFSLIEDFFFFEIVHCDGRAEIKMKLINV